MSDHPLLTSQLAERAPGTPAVAVEGGPLTAGVRARPVAERRDRSVAAIPLALPTAVASLRSRFKLSGKTLFFIIAVVLPTLVAAVYYYAIASDQYVSEFRFGVRAADMLRNDATAIFEGMPAASQIGLDLNMVTQYIQSREIVADLQKKLDLRAIYADRGADFLSRLAPKASAEDLVEYWRHTVDPFFDLTTGLISVRVRAFTPEDAQRVGNEVISLSENS